MKRKLELTPEGKRRMGNLMRIHDKWYDVTGFEHPGGPIALGLGKGRDATALFEAHHSFTSRGKLASYLRKYEVTDVSRYVAGTASAAESGAKGRSKVDPHDFALLDEVALVDKREGHGDIHTFVWNRVTADKTSNQTDRDAGQQQTQQSCELGPTNDENEWRSPFARQLREEVRNLFRLEAQQRGLPSVLHAIKATPKRYAQCFLFLFLTLATLPFFFTGHWWTLVATPVLLWLWAVNTAHDASHFAVSADWRVNCAFTYVSPWTMSPLMWYHQHVVGHHAYPNVAHRDPDIAHAPAFLRLHTSIRWKKAHKFQFVSTWLIWTFGAALYLTIVPLKALAMGVLNRAVFLGRRPAHRSVMHVLGRVLTALSLWAWPWFVFEPLQAFVWAVVPILVHSLCFMLSTQVNHLTEENAASRDDDYYVHQVLTSHSFSHDSNLVFFFTGGLNYQIEHHLFPTVNHCHLHKIRPIVKRLCKAHNIHYHESASLWEALRKYVAHVRNMAVRPSVKTQ